MGFFTVTPKKKPKQEPPKDTYYIEPAKEPNPDEESHDTFVEQENQR
jgi:hypothetical protein